jgi:sarcosine oxidase subunit beta
MTERRTADAVIVGAGISGIMSAYFLAKAGMRPLVVEQGLIAGAASGRNGGHVSPSTYDSAQKPLGLLAVQMWPELVREIELPTEYRQDGSLGIVLESDAALLDTARELPSDPADPMRVLSRDDALEMIPHLPPTVAGAIFRPSRGNVNPVIAAKSFAHAARQLGVEFWEGTTVTGIATEHDAVTGVQTSRGDVATPIVVNTAGAWAALIGDMVGLRIPVIPHRLQILITDAVPAFTGATFGGNNIYARQALSGQVHFGLLSGPAWDPPLDRFSNTVTAPTLQHTAKQMAELTPGLAAVPILRSWAGTNSVTPDMSPIVDAPPQVRGFYVAAGFWNGFGIGVATGKAVSELILDRRAGVDISGLALERFARYPDGITYPYDRWRAAQDGLVQAAGWPVTGVRAGLSS